MIKRVNVNSDRSGVFQVHSSFAKSRLSIFVQFDEDLMKRALDYFEEESSVPLVVCGVSGAGKSSFLADFVINRCAKGYQAIVHYVGCTSESTCLSDMLHRQYCEIRDIVCPLLAPHQHPSLA